MILMAKSKTISSHVPRPTTFLFGTLSCLVFQMSHTKVGITWANLFSRMIFHGSHQLSSWFQRQVDSELTIGFAYRSQITIQRAGTQLGISAASSLASFHSWPPMIVLLDLLKLHIIRKWQLLLNHDKNYWIIKNSMNCLAQWNSTLD